MYVGFVGEYIRVKVETVRGCHRRESQSLKSDEEFLPGPVLQIARRMKAYENLAEELCH